jgi:hypothetical protein
VVIHVRLLFGRITTSLLLLLLQLRHCANLIFFENTFICNEYYLTLFFYFWCLIKFICIISFFYY